MASISETISGNPIVNAVAITLSRKAQDNRKEFWCPPGLQDWVKATIAVHGGDLLRTIHQAMRVVRLGDRIDRRGYESFLYVGLKRLSSAAIKEAVLSATAEGRLAGIVEATDEGVRFLEPEMNGAEKAYDLGYGQIVRAIAILDVLHNLLWGEIRDETAAIRGRACRASAKDVANRLFERAKEVIAEHSEAEHSMKQGAYISRFLESTNRLQGMPGSLDDEAIMKFWETHGILASAPDGFRRFRSSARRLLAYRMVWADRHVESTFLSYSPSVEEGGFNLEALEGRRALEGRMPDAPQGLESDDEQGADAYVSPLPPLFEDPGNRVKWFRSEADEETIKRVLGVSGSDGGDAWSPFPGAPEIAFSRTLLRFLVFGGLQEVKINAVKNRRPFAMEKTEGIDAYADAARDIAEIAEGLETAALAAVHVLVAQDRMIGADVATRMLRAEFAAFAETIRSGVHGDLRRDLGTIMRLWRARLADGSSDASRRLEKAYKGLERAGFRKKKIQDFDDESITEGLAAGVEAARASSAYVRSLSPALMGVAGIRAMDDDGHRGSRRMAFDEDHDRFREAFLRIDEEDRKAARAVEPPEGPDPWEGSEAGHLDGPTSGKVPLLSST